MTKKRFTRILNQSDFARRTAEFDPWQDMLDDWKLPASTTEVEVSYFAHETE